MTEIRNKINNNFYIYVDKYIVVTSLIRIYEFNNQPQALQDVRFSPRFSKSTKHKLQQVPEGSYLNYSYFKYNKKQLNLERQFASEYNSVIIDFIENFMEKHHIERKEDATRFEISELYPQDYLELASRYYNIDAKEKKLFAKEFQMWELPEYIMNMTNKLISEDNKILLYLYRKKRKIEKVYGDKLLDDVHFHNYLERSINEIKKLITECEQNSLSECDLYGFADPIIEVIEANNERDSFDIDLLMNNLEKVYNIVANIETEVVKKNLGDRKN